MHPIDPTKRVDFAEFKEELHNVFLSVSNKVEREWPKTVGSQISHLIVLGHYRISLTAYDTLRYFVAELPKPDAARKPEFVVSGPPLLRSMLDALANVLFLFEDISARTVEFSKRAWKEEFERELRYRKRYSGDPSWSGFLAFLEREGAEVRTKLGISDDEAKRLRRWPTLGAMISADTKERDRLRDDRRRSYLTFLNDWFYKDFSSETHLSPPGFFRRAQLVIRESRLWGDSEWTEQGILRTKALTAAIGFMLAMGAELEHELQFGMRERIVRIWSRLNYFSPDLRDLYEQRPAALLKA